MAGGDEGENNGLPKVQERGKDECLEKVTEPDTQLKLHPQRTTSDTEGEDENERVPGYHEHIKVFVDNGNQHQSTQPLKTVSSDFAEFVGDINSAQGVNDTVYDATEKISDVPAITSDHFPDEELKTIKISENIMRRGLSQKTLDVPENAKDNVVETQNHVQDVVHKKTVDIPCNVETLIWNRMLVSCDMPEYVKDHTVGTPSYVQDIIRRTHNIPENDDAQYVEEKVDGAPEKVQDGKVQTAVSSKDVAETSHGVSVAETSDGGTSVDAQEQISSHEITDLELFSEEDEEGNDGEVVSRIRKKSLSVTKRTTIGRQRLTWLGKLIRNGTKRNVKPWKQRLFRKKNTKGW